MSVDSIDDKEDMQFADEAFDILGFSKVEKYDVFKVFLITLETETYWYKKVYNHYEPMFHMNGLIYTNEIFERLLQL